MYILSYQVIISNQDSRMPWPWGSSRKAGRGARGHEERDGDGLEDEEWASDRSSPFLRWLGSARLALCGPKSADGSTVTMVFVFAPHVREGDQREQGARRALELSPRGSAR